MAIRRASFEENQVAVGFEDEIRGERGADVRLELERQLPGPLRRRAESFGQRNLGVVVADGNFARAADVAAELHGEAVMSLGRNDRADGDLGRGDVDLKDDVN